MTSPLAENSPSTRGIIFFGFETLLRGWLVFKSGFLAVALFAIAGVIATSGWLFIRGVDDVNWRERAALAATSIWR